MRPYCKVLPCNFSLDTVVCTSMQWVSEWLHMTFLWPLSVLWLLFSLFWPAVLQWLVSEALIDVANSAWNEKHSPVCLCRWVRCLYACRNRQLSHLQLIFFKLICTFSQRDLKLITYKLTDGENQHIKLIIVSVISSIFGSISGEAI